MAKRKRAANRRTTPRVDARSAATNEMLPPVDDDRITTSNLTLHELFSQQARDMLDRSDLDEEQKQSILVAMSCPCCGAGAMSFTAKLKRRT